MTIKVSLGFAFLGMFFAATAWGNTFQCIDASGDITISNVPCPPDSRAAKVNVFPAGRHPVNIIESESTPNSFGTDQQHLQSFPSNSTPDDNATRNKLDELQKQLQQAEIDRVREKEELEDAKVDAAIQIEQESADREKQAVEAIKSEHQDQKNREKVNSNNNFYLVGFLLAIVGLFSYAINKNRSEAIMNENQKYGITIIILSLLLLLFVIVISDGWMHQIDFLNNLMLSLKIQLFNIQTACESGSMEAKYQLPCSRYLIDMPTKHAALVLIGTSTYGLLTYLNITPPFMPWRRGAASK